MFIKSKNTLGVLLSGLKMTQKRDLVQNRSILWMGAIKLYKFSKVNDIFFLLYIQNYHCVLTKKCYSLCEV